MKKKNASGFYDVPDLKTLKEIIVYGTKTGGDKKQFVYLDAEKQERTKTFNETWREICGLGTYMYLRGINGGQKAAIISENSYEWVVAYYSTLVGGNISVPMDCKLPAQELADQIVRSGCDAIFYSKKCADSIEVIKSTPGVAVKHYFCISDFPENKRIGLEAYDAGNRDFVDAEVKPEDLACIVYTSGTTGKSKGVMLSHKNIASDAVASCKVMHGEHAIGFLPLSHTFCWVGALFSGYLLTEWGYICDSLKDLQGDMKKYKPQNFSAVPLVVETMYDRIWKTAKKMGKEEVIKKGIKLSRGLMKVGIDKRRTIFKQILDNLGGNLEIIVCGGANLDPKHEIGMYDFGIQIINGYGMTECSPAVTCNRVDNYKIGSVGLPLPCNEIKIVEPNEFGVGEIYVRGDNVMMGYYNEPEATAECFDGDWFKTGDYGRIDEDGFLFFVGRKKNLIVLSNGKNVSPEELEDKLVRFDYVNEVLVYEEEAKITAEFYLNEAEYPNARDLLKEDMKKFNASMPNFKQVKKIKLRDTEFPKTITLKIARNYDNK